MADLDDILWQRGTYWPLAAPQSMCVLQLPYAGGRAHWKPDPVQWEPIGALITEQENAAGLAEAQRNRQLFGDVLLPKTPENKTKQEYASMVINLAAKHGKPLPRTFTPKNAPDEFAGVHFLDEGHLACTHCGQQMVRSDARIAYCSDRCRTAARHAQTARWASAHRQPRPAPEPRACLCCGAVFTPKRADAKTCSARCRKAASRVA